MTDKKLLKIAYERIKEMGAIIRRLDENDEHSDQWLMDDDYVPNTEEIEKAVNARKYRVPVTWEMSGEMEIEANSIEDARDKAYHTPLPEGSFVKGSFEVRDDEIEEVE